MNWRSLLRLGGTFFLGNVLARLVSFIALPVYTHFLAPDEIGYYDLSITYGTIIAALFFMDAWVGVMKRLLDKNDHVSPGTVISSGAFLVGTASAAVTAIAIGISILTPLEAVYLVLACLVTGAVRDLWAFTARGLGYTSAFAFSGVVGAVTSLGVTMSLLTLTDLGATALYAGLIAGNLAQLIFLEAIVHVLRLMFKSRLDTAVLRSLLLFSLPLGINSVSYWIFTGIGRIAVSTELSLAANGVFATASKIGAALGLLSTVVTLVWQQTAFSHDGGDKRFFERGMLVAVSLYLAGGAVLAPLGMFAYRVIVAESFQSGMAVVPGFVIVAAVAGYSAFVGNIFYAIDKTSVLFVSAVVVMVFTGALTFPLVRALGIDGANIALATGYIVGLVVRYVVLKRASGIGHPWRAELLSVVLLTGIWVSTAEGILWLSLPLAMAATASALMMLRKATGSSGSSRPEVAE